MDTHFVYRTTVYMDARVGCDKTHTQLRGVTSVQVDGQSRPINMRIIVWEHDQNVCIYFHSFNTCVENRLRAPVHIQYGGVLLHNILAMYRGRLRSPLASS